MEGDIDGVVAFGDFVARVLAVLMKRGAAAEYFLGGQSVDQKKDGLAAQREAGHTAPKARSTACRMSGDTFR